MNDLIAFLNARIDEDEANARARCGIFPSPGVEDSGAVWLHIQYGGNAVVVHYAHPAEGYGDMAALKAWADTEQGFTQDRACREVAAKRAIVKRHQPGEDPASFGPLEGQLYCKAESSDEDLWYANPWPCSDVLVLAAIWNDHADYRDEWKP